jgi:hypothetical protein
VSFTVPDVIALRLRTLRDIEGVLGSFVIGERGELLGRDVTAACGSEVLALVGGRLQQLCDAFVSADIGGAFESTTLYFPQYKLHIRALGNLFIVAVVSAEVNLPALKMAMNMLGRQLVNDLSAASVTSLAPAAHRDSREPPAPNAGRSSREPPAPHAGRSSLEPPAPNAPRESRAPLDPRESRVPRDSHEPGPQRDSHESIRPSQEPPPPAARESGVPPRSYRGTKVAN